MTEPGCTIMTAASSRLIAMSSSPHDTAIMVATPPSSRPPNAERERDQGAGQEHRHLAGAMGNGAAASPFPFLTVKSTHRMIANAGTGDSATADAMNKDDTCNCTSFRMRSEP